MRTAATATSRTSEQTSRSWLRWWTVRGWSPLGGARARGSYRTLDHDECSDTMDLIHTNVMKRVRIAWHICNATPSGNTRVKSGRNKGRRARLILIVLVLAIIGGVGYGAFWSISTVRASFPQTKGSIELYGLSGPVDVKRDGNGI